MSLIAIISNNKQSINRKLLLYASKHTPSLIIDCANVANPHSLSDANLHEIYVIELELLYKFRDVLLRVPSLVRQIKAKKIIVTTSDHLFNYQDEKENNNIIEHAWELMRKIGEKYTIVVGLKENSMHEKFAKKYAHLLGVDQNRTYSIKPTYDGRYNFK